LSWQQPQRRQKQEQSHHRRKSLAAGRGTECAWAAAATKNCSLRDKFRSLTSRFGGKKAPALVAMSHVKLMLIYHVLETRQPFEDRKAPLLGESQKQRLIRHHIRRLGKLGVAIPRTAFLPVAHQSSASSE
jgi:hypothetical protein